ncbi:barstar family protein [Microbulbifer litoralis]|uniref:barstar family protein n=1 Tax=Microbulbifer litoralis TaxID=2933965 RepID=UPI003CE4A51A
MDTIIIDCQDVRDESDFWQLYIDIVRPEGADFFGRNASAFLDAISGGGPGWPGDVKLLFVHAESLSAINSGSLLRRLQEIQLHSKRVRVELGADT